MLHAFKCEKKNHILLEAFFSKHINTNIIVVEETRDLLNFPKMIHKLFLFFLD